MLTRQLTQKQTQSLCAHMKYEFQDLSKREKKHTFCLSSSYLISTRPFTARLTISEHPRPCQSTDPAICSKTVAKIPRPGRRRDMMWNKNSAMVMISFSPMCQVVISLFMTRTAKVLATVVQTMKLNTTRQGSPERDSYAGGEIRESAGEIWKTFAVELRCAEACDSLRFWYF